MMSKSPDLPSLTGLSRQLISLTSASLTKGTLRIYTLQGASFDAMKALHGAGSRPAAQQRPTAATLP